MTVEDELYPITRRGFREQAYFTLCYSPVRDEAGQVVGILVTVLGTTERVSAEPSFRDSEERLQQVFAQLVFELVNPSYQEFLPNRALLGRPVRKVIPELDPGVLGILAVSNPVREPDGTVSGVVAVVVDVTAHVRARQELERANCGLEEFARVVSHHLQEPLRMGNSYSKLLVRRLGQDATGEQREFVGFIRTGVKRLGVKRLQRLIWDLLSYFRPVYIVAELAARQVSLRTHSAGHSQRWR